MISLGNNGCPTSTPADDLLLMLRARPDLMREVERLRALAAAAPPPDELERRRERAELQRIARAARLVYNGENAWQELGAALGEAKAPF